MRLSHYLCDRNHVPSTLASRKFANVTGALRNQSAFQVLYSRKV